MKRLLPAIAILIVLSTGCDPNKFRPVFSINLKDCLCEEGTNRYHLTSGTLELLSRKSDGYWRVVCTLPNTNAIVFEPTFDYACNPSLSLYDFSWGEDYLYIEAGAYPTITYKYNGKTYHISEGALNKKGFDLSYNLERYIDFSNHRYTFSRDFDTISSASPSVSNESPAEVPDLPAEVAVEEAAVETGTLLEGNASSPRLSADTETNPDGELLMSGLFSETTFYQGLNPVNWALPLMTYHIDIYQNVLVTRHSDGSGRRYPFTSVSSSGSLNYESKFASTEFSYTYNPKDGTILYSTSGGGVSYWCRIVPAGGSGSAAQSPQGGSYGSQGQYDAAKESRAQMYRSQYDTWERTVINHWNTLTGMVSGAAKTSVKMNFRNAQSQMRTIRQNAQMEGIHINASPWENQTIPYGLDD